MKMANRNSSWLARVGAVAVGAARSTLGVWATLLGCLAGMRRGGWPRREVTRQLFFMSNRSLLFIAVTLGFLGMVSTYQSCAQTMKVTGDLGQVGSQLLRLVVSDFAPVVTGLMLATRIGAGIAAEIGTMKVTEQIDALRMCGVRPLDFLLSPRLIASVVATVALTVVGAAALMAAGGVTAAVTFDVNPRVFFDASKTEVAHVALGLVKSIAFGVAIPVVAGHCGFAAKSSSAGVGAATTSAVVGGSFSVIALDFTLSVLGYWLMGGHP